MKLYGAFSKVEEQDDGTIIVEGIASTETVDSDGEVVKASAIEAALPDYMRHGTGALREMHQPLAAGTAVLAVEGGVTTIKAHVVDPIAIKKVKTETYKGFSIGGKVLARDEAEKNTITGLRLVEVSLVDRPANPDAVLTMWKADAVEDEGREPDDQSDPGDENPEPAEKAAEVEDLAKADEPADETVEKGMGQVAWLADLLDSLKCLQECAEWESTIEGDSSAIPDQIKAAVTTLADLLVAMVNEETAELRSPEGDVDVIAASDDLDEDDKTADDDVAMADPIADLAKVEEPAGDDLAKFEDMLAKALAPLNETIAKQAETMASQAKEIETLKAQPSAAKGVVMQVSKAEDVGQAVVEKVEPVLNPDGSVNEAATEFKKLARAGGLFAA